MPALPRPGGREEERVGEAEAATEDKGEQEKATDEPDRAHYGAEPPVLRSPQRLNWLHAETRVHVVAQPAVGL